MRKLIISGTYAQYRDWLQANGASPRAAVHIGRADDLMGYDPDHDEIVLTGTYHDNPAYQSEAYLWFINAGRCLAIASC